MCCFAFAPGPLARVARWLAPPVKVAETHIFGRRDGPMQVLVYSMKLSARSQVAMILPLPVRRGCGEDGVEFVSRLRGHRGEAEAPTPVIAVTAFPENYVRETMHELGFRSYLVKPVNPERIAREVLAVQNYVRGAGDGHKP